MSEKSEKILSAALSAICRFVARASVYFTFTTLGMFLLNRLAGAPETSQYLSFDILLCYLLFAAVSGAAHFVFDIGRLIMPVRIIIHAVLTFAAFLLAVIILPEKSVQVVGGIVVFTVAYVLALCVALVFRAAVSRRKNEKQDYEKQF